MSLRICWPVISMTSKPQFGGERVKVSDVFDLQMGKTPSRKNLEYWNNGDHEWVSIKDLGSYSKYVGTTKETISELGRKESGIKPVPKDTLIMSFKLSLGKTAITTKETYTNEAIMAFLDRGEYSLDLEYMWHQFRIKNWEMGTNIAVMGKTLNKKTLGASTICVPSILQQQKIAMRLNFVQNLIDKALGEVKLLENLVKSRFVEMFGAVNELRPGFTIKTINDVCSSIIRGPFGSALKKSFFVSKGEATYKVYEQKHAIQKRADIGTYYITSEKFDSLKRFECKPGDILMSCSGTMGKLYQLPINCEPGIINQALCKFTLNESVLPDYFFRVMGQIIDELGAKGSGIKNVSSVKYIKAIKIPVPPLFLQQQFADFVAQVDKSGFAVRQQIEKLQLLYDSLAQEYFGD